jgi:hypothetical protein
MPTTVDRFIASYQLCQQVADMQNNMRANVQIIQAAKNAGTIPTFAAAQQAFRDLGSAFLSRIATLTTLVANNLTALQNGTAALGITWTDITDMKTLLTTWATNLSTATITTQTQLDNSVAALLAAVPAAIQPY